MYWRPFTQITSVWPLGGVGSFVDAESTRPSESEFGAFRTPGSLMNVTTVITTTISAAATVQPISSLVLPWIWAATAPFDARKR